MAIAGSVTVAYRLTMVRGELLAIKTTAPSWLCIAPVYAVALVQRGEAVTVAVANMAEFWRLWDAENE